MSVEHFLCPSFGSIFLLNLSSDNSLEFSVILLLKSPFEDLAFSSELGFEERKELALVSKKYGLNYRRVVENKPNGRKRTYLVITKKIGPEFIIEQLEREGSWGRYSLVHPKGGDR